MSDDRERRWIAHCHRMAEASYALADWCEDADMMANYIKLGGLWIELAASTPPASRVASSLN